MTHQEQLAGFREELSALDKEIIGLFLRRMAFSDQIADVKMAGNIPITDSQREQRVIENAIALASAPGAASATGAASASEAASATGAASATEVAALMRAILALSKRRQHNRLFSMPPLDIPASGESLGPAVRAAYSGVPGAWGESAAIALYPQGTYTEFGYFDDVFDAVKSGAADVGVVPIENSQTGAIGEVYDLLRRSGCYIVGQTWVDIAQCLLAREGVSIHELREVFSHPEGFKQCRRFLKNRNWDLTACRNTAAAAQMVAQSAERRAAAIGSRRAAQNYGLNVLAPDIMDNAGNRTRFIAIAARPVYDGACDTTCVSFSTAHVAGALCAVLESFMVAGVNLSRIESRPVSAERYRFFADLRANLRDPETVDALRQAAMHCDYFEILGCYPT